MFHIPKLILSLFLDSQSRLLKFAFYTLPIALFFSITSFLFVNNILKSYKNYLINSYIGSQGRVTIISTPPFIKKLQEVSKKHHLIFSPKVTFKSFIVFKNKTPIIKSAQIVILNQSYLQKKFHSNDIFINKALKNGFGDMNISSFKKLQYDKKSIPIKKIKIIDTGFLGNYPTIFLSFKNAKKLFPSLKTNQIEYLNKNTKFIKTLVEKTAKQYGVLEYKIKDLIEDTKETKEFFQKISVIQKFIMGFIFILALGIVILSVAIMIEFKKSSLKTLHLIGMSKKELNLTISLIVLSTISIILTLSVISTKALESLFLKITGFGSDFFVPVGFKEIGFVFVLGVILSMITYISSSLAFKGKE
ncbi:MAG: hypothetical protein ABGX26_03830 [Nautiliaceae bacterium]